MFVVQEVARRSVTKTQVEVENGDEEEEVVQTVSLNVFFPISLFSFTIFSHLIDILFSFVQN